MKRVLIAVWDWLGDRYDRWWKWRGGRGYVATIIIHESLWSPSPRGSEQSKVDEPPTQSERREDVPNVVDTEPI